MNNTMLLLRNQMNVIEQLSLEIITKATIIIVTKEHSYRLSHSGGACIFCGGHRIVVITNATSFLSRR